MEPRIEQRFFKRLEKKPIRKLKAIVIHWPAGRGIPSLNGLWNWMNDYSQNSYHYFVSKEKIIQIRDLKLRAIHCGHKTYRKKAKDYFGYDVCSKNDSPNNYTLGICALHDELDGAYHTSTMDSLISLCAMLCLKYKLDPGTALWRHSDITNEKEKPCPLGFFEDDEDPDDLWRSFKKWVDAEMKTQKALKATQVKRREHNTVK